MSTAVDHKKMGNKGEKTDGSRGPCSCVCHGVSSLQPPYWKNSRAAYRRSWCIQYIQFNDSENKRRHFERTLVSLFVLEINCKVAFLAIKIRTDYVTGSEMEKRLKFKKCKLKYLSLFDQSDPQASPQRRITSSEVQYAPCNTFALQKFPI